MKETNPELERLRKNTIELMVDVASLSSKYLGNLIKNYTDYISFEPFKQGLMGVVTSNGDIINTCNTDYLQNFKETILTTLHEIGHKLNTKSTYYFEDEYRVRKFEGRVAERLGIPITSKMTLAAHNNDLDTFARLFNNTPGYKQLVGKKIKRSY